MPMIFRQPERKTVAVDLDQTLAHTLEAMVHWHNQVYDTQLTVADFDTYEFHKVWGGSIQESHAKVREFYESSHFEQIQPIHDFALEALKMLKKRKFTLVIITSRQQFIAEETKKFVDKHYPGIFESIYFCNLELSDTEQLEYVSKPKSAICQEIGVDVLIDDNLEHAMECANTLDIEVLLYDRKGQYRWNHLSNQTTTNIKNSKKMTTTTVTHTKKANSHTLTSMSRQLYHNHLHAPLPSNVTRVSSWREIIAFFPKPHSPLRNCYYPQDLIYDEQDEEEESDEQEYDGIEYETIEVDMDLTDDDEDYHHYHHPVKQQSTKKHSFTSVSISNHDDNVDDDDEEEEMVWI
ncbi:hypothetical protein BDA99DRAFT_601920 [Phascolomyces articulosus]|uniref:Uncharacterized protein n=1 Tax=Phascolomyces articulosus TaxID=60185 RepID=A0AAD5K908_9FUNG|nr:hypothetical protein BDA99DRAFT_601920 [Phascolomyces articulosus]